MLMGSGSWTGSVKDYMSILLCSFKGIDKWFLKGLEKGVLSGLGVQGFGVEADV